MCLAIICAASLLPLESTRVACQALALLQSPAHRTGALGLLYHLSMEREHRPLFLPASRSAPSAAAALPPLLLAAADLRSAPELAALAINLSLDDQLAAVCTLSPTHAAGELMEGVQCLARELVALARHPLPRQTASRGMLVVDHTSCMS